MICIGRVKVVDGGALTTVQDLGRPGYQSYGVPPGGAMDAAAFLLGNIALGNPENSPGLECTVVGPELEMEEDEIICITGGDLGPTLDGDPCPMWRTLQVRKGSVLRFRGLKSGCRAYVTFAGGIVCPPVLGSASTFLRASMGGLSGRELRAGDVFFVDSSRPEKREVVIPPRIRPVIDPNPEVRVLPGPQENLFSRQAMDVFLTSGYRVGVQADRMGYRLAGPAVESSHNLSVYSRGIPLGGIQIDGEGAPIVALKDRQTVGGYPQIATVISADVDIFAQLKPGDGMQFKAVFLPEAHACYRDKMEGIRRFKETVAVFRRS
ncbi:MAG: biotin-dependent carboxyltransferase family protein [Bacillota bacterium]